MRLITLIASALGALSMATLAVGQQFQIISGSVGANVSETIDGQSDNNSNSALLGVATLSATTSTSTNVNGVGVSATTTGGLTSTEISFSVNGNGAGSAEGGYGTGGGGIGVTFDLTAPAKVQLANSGEGDFTVFLSDSIMGPSTDDVLSTYFPPFQVDYVLGAGSYTFQGNGSLGPVAGEGLPSSLSGSLTIIGPAPEPATLSVLATAGLIAASRRRRRVAAH